MFRRAKMLRRSKLFCEVFFKRRKHTTGICLPFPDPSSSLPKHWAITSSMVNPRQRRTPISLYWPMILSRRIKMNCDHSPRTLRFFWKKIQVRGFRRYSKITYSSSISRAAAEPIIVASSPYWDNCIIWGAFIIHASLTAVIWSIYEKGNKYTNI